MPASLALSNGEAHVWFSDLRACTGDALLARYRALLTSQELERNARYYFERDRLRDLVTRACVRTLLSRYLPQIAPSQWCFEADARGRPAIANREAADAGLAFNISHGGALILFAVTRHAAIGVDVEDIARAAPLDIAARFFSAAEHAELLSQPENRRSERFYRFWTLKESYIKARSLGLSLPLQSFGFTLAQHGAIGFWTDVSLADPSARWAFVQWRVADDHVAALCIERTSSQRVALVVRRVIPLVDDSIVELEPHMTWRSQQ